MIIRTSRNKPFAEKPLKINASSAGDAIIHSFFVLVNENKSRYIALIEEVDRTSFGTHQQKQRNHDAMTTESARRIRRLTDLERTQPGVVVRMKLERDESQRLGDLGLHVGAAVRVLAGTEKESILIAVGDARIGVNYDVARQIYVY